MNNIILRENRRTKGFWNMNPDYNFNLSHNIHVLEETNKEADRRENEIDKKVADATGNVADILAHYAKFTLALGKHKSIEEYVGREMAKKLFGDRLMSKYGSTQIMIGKN